MAQLPASRSLHEVNHIREDHNKPFKECFSQGALTVYCWSLSATCCTRYSASWRTSKPLIPCSVRCYIAIETCTGPSCWYYVALLPCSRAYCFRPSTKTTKAIFRPKGFESFVVLCSSGHTFYCSFSIITNTETPIDHPPKYLYMTEELLNSLRVVVQTIFYFHAKQVCESMNPAPPAPRDRSFMNGNSVLGAVLIPLIISNLGL